MPKNYGEYFNDTPMADPTIRSEYEAAIGRFLVAFNRLDNQIAQLIAITLKKAERDDLISKFSYRGYEQKVDLLDLLSIVPGPAQKFRTAPFSGLRSIGGERNLVAHGHFEQNPYDGSYEIIEGKGLKSRPLSIETINAHTEKCDELWDAMRYLMAIFWFDEINNESE